MNDATRYAVIAALAILAVAVAAATLDATAESGASGSVEGGGVGDAGPGGFLPLPRGGPSEDTAVDADLPRTILRLLLVLVAVAMLVYALFNPREVLVYLLQGAAVAAVLGGLVVLAYLLATAGESSPTGNGSLFGGSAGGGGGATPPSPPGLVVFVLLGLAIVGTALALIWQSSGETPEPAPSADSEDSRRAAVGQAAGRAADRIEADADVDNGVYRAWREMTALLDVDDPATSTPGEFATAAAEAGLGREDVDELTRLFEDVRYGGVAPEPALERRAVATFRRIERRYAREEQ